MSTYEHIGFLLDGTPIYARPEPPGEDYVPPGYVPNNFTETWVSDFDDEDK